MKLFLTVILIIQCLPSFSQCDSFDIQFPFDTLPNWTPFKSEGVCNCQCNRPWMLPEEEMNALKLEIWKFDSDLKGESRDSSLDYTALYKMVFRTEFVVRIEFDWTVNKQFCAQRDSSLLQLTADDNLGTFESFGNKFLKRTTCHFYHGNARITRYYTEYFIRQN